MSKKIIKIRKKEKKQKLNYKEVFNYDDLESNFKINDKFISSLNIKIKSSIISFMCKFILIRKRGIIHG